jgi:DNA-binding winged helix-turn-helix (wHTH) protein/tetratricopeptide (TPR) repeat protein
MSSEMVCGTNLTFADFTIDRADERLIGPGGPVKLGNKAFQVLLMLAEHEGRLLTKDALFSSVWDGTIVSESALTSVVKELRHALNDDPKSPRYIESVYGRGYRLLPPVSRTEAAARRAETAPAMTPQPGARLGAPPLLYVGAFDDLAARDSSPHLAAVLREEILFALSRFRDIRLVSDPTTTAPPVTGYGDRDYQLTLKLVHDGSSLRAFTRLSRLTTRTIIWADNIELADSQLGPTVDLLVRRIAAAALPRMQDDLLGNLPAQPHDVYDLYFLTRLKMRGQASFEEARDMAATWEALIREHPNFALAYPPLARLYDTDYCYSGLGSTGDAERRRAYELAHQAFALDPTESHFHTMKGWAHLWAGEWMLARQHFDEALQLNPYNERRLVEVATGLMFLDELTGADALLQRCRDLTPFATETPYEEQGLLDLLTGQYERAAEHLSLVRRYHPEDLARTTPTLMAELYALLAAAGSQAPDLAERAVRWRRSMTERWCAAEAPTDDRLKHWALFHSPFKTEARRAWFLDLLDVAMTAAPGAAASHHHGPSARPTAELS